MHSCWHTHPQGLYSSELHAVNHTMLRRHVEDVGRLLRSVRRSVEESNRLTQGASTQQVVLVTSGATYMENGTEMDDCITRMNRAAERVAHSLGFAVLERGEIERRLMFKSLQTDQPLLAPNMHLSQPAQNIVSTSLLQLLHCLQSAGVHMGNLTENLLASNLVRRSKRARSSDPKPLHSPPG